MTADTLTAYAADLQAKDYAYKSQYSELTVLKQAIKWLIQRGHLAGMTPIELKLRKAECEPAYCYRPEEIHAIVEFCRSKPELAWLANVTIGLACTGLRIAEFASIRWEDIDFDACRLTLTDETARVVRGDRKPPRNEVVSQPQLPDPSGSAAGAQVGDACRRLCIPRTAQRAVEARHSPPNARARRHPAANRQVPDGAGREGV